MIPKLSLSVRYIVLCTFLFLVVPRPVWAEPYEVIDVTNGGTIKGVATWKGEIPDLPPVEIQIDTELCGEEMPSQALQVHPTNHGVRHVLVYLERVEKGKAPAFTMART